MEKLKFPILGKETEDKNISVQDTLSKDKNLKLINKTLNCTYIQPRQSSIKTGRSPGQRLKGKDIILTF